MVDVVYWLSVGGLAAQAGQLGSKVGSQLARCCVHQMNRVNSCSGFAVMTTP